MQNTWFSNKIDRQLKAKLEARMETGQFITSKISDVPICKQRLPKRYLVTAEFAAIYLGKLRHRKLLLSAYFLRPL